MVLPLTPKNVTLRFPPTGAAVTMSIRHTGFTQKPPYNVLTNATREMARLISSFPAGNTGPVQNGQFGYGGLYRAWSLRDQSTYVGTLDYWFKASLDNAVNTALKRLQGRAHDERASLGVALGETREAYKMMSNRLVQLYRGFSFLKKGNFYAAARTFGLVRKRPRKGRVGKTGKLYWRKHPRREAWYPAPSRDAQGRSKVKDYASLVLEYNFGWAPLIGDVQAAIKVIQRDPYVDRKIRGGGKDSRVSPEQVYYGDSLRDRYEGHTLSTRAAAGGVYRVSNPNYDLASRLGLVNLASVALELVPFSFLANYIVNLDEWVGNLSNDYRASMVDVWWTAKCQSVRTHRSYHKVLQKTESSSTSECLSSFRNVGSLPNVTLQVRQRFIPSLTRALNVSSLLVVLFWGKRV